MYIIVFFTWQRFFLSSVYFNAVLRSSVAVNSIHQVVTVKRWGCSPLCDSHSFLLNTKSRMMCNYWSFTSYFKNLIRKEKFFMLCGRKRVSSRSISHFAMLFSVHYLLAVGDKPLGIDHTWLAKLTRRIAQNEWVFAGLGSWGFWKKTKSGYSSCDMRE